MHPSRAHDPDKIRRRRIEAGKTLPALAEEAGVAKSHLSNIERGQSGAGPRVLARLAAALHCEVRDFMPPEVLDASRAGAPTPVEAP